MDGLRHLQFFYASVDVVLLRALGRCLPIWKGIDIDLGVRSLKEQAGHQGTSLDLVVCDE
jgi:hypothetical protein